MATKVVSAQTEALGDAAAQARYEAALEATLGDPRDVEAAYGFAEAAVAIGDFYGAIAALERILLVDPDRPDIKLRLGELYRQVGASSLAETYLGQGLRSTDVPEELRERARALFEAAGSERAVAYRRHTVSGSLYLGGRYETNTNAGPGSNRVRFFDPGSGTVVEGPFLDDDDKAEADVSGLAALNMDYAYDLGFQAGHTIEADVFLLGQRYSQVSKANTGVVDLELGPRVMLGPAETTTASVQPYVKGSLVSLDDDLYRTGVGAGINARVLLPGRVLFDGDAVATFEDFDGTTKEPNAPDQTGDFYRLTPSLSWQPHESTFVELRGLLGTKNANEDFQSFDEWGATLAVTQGVRVPRWPVDRSWSATLFGGYRNTSYDEADPTIDPGQTQNDDRLDFGVDLNVPLAEQLNLELRFQQTWNSSNIPNEEYNNSAWTAALRFIF